MFIQSYLSFLMIVSQSNSVPYSVITDDFQHDNSFKKTKRKAQQIIEKYDFSQICTTWAKRLLYFLVNKNILHQGMQETFKNKEKGQYQHRF